MPRKKPKKRTLHVPFPLAGLNRKGPYRQQAPYSSSDLLNVRATATMEGRDRGGSRPGLVYSHVDDLGSNVRMLAPMALALGDSFTTLSDNFSGLSLAAAWTQASWASDVPSILPGNLAGVSTATSEGEVVHDAISINTSSNYTVEALFAPWIGSWHGDYRLYLRMDNTTPAYATDGVQIEIVQTDDAGAYSATLKTYTGGVETVTDTTSGTLSATFPGWLTATVAGNVVTVWWNGAQILTGTVDAHTGTRVGMGMECTNADGLCLCNAFRVQYYSTGVVTEATRTQLLASAGGNLWRELTYGRMTQIVSDLTTRSNTSLSGVQIGQALYIADYGDLRDTGTDGTMASAVLDDTGAQDWSLLNIDTDSDVCIISNGAGGTADGTYAITAVHATNGCTLSPDPGDGTCSYRIERGPKVYTPLTDTFALWIATSGKGQVPSGCPLIARFNGRAVLGGAEIAPHVWFMSRKDDVLDFDYSQTDSLAAVAGTAAEAGIPGDPLTALFTFSDDYLIFGCIGSIWRLAGDPAYGGKLDNLSHKVGIIDKDAWCTGPNGELVFLSLGGLYYVNPGGNSYPVELSENSLPEEFKNIDPKTTTVQLEYDVADRGIHIYITEDSSNTRVHWWFDWDKKGFWPQTLAADHEPTATCSYQASATEESGVLLGCRDGYLRRFSSLAANDTGTSFSSYVKVGPIPLAPDNFVGTIVSMNCTMATESGDVTWALQPSDTFQGAGSATAISTDTWSAGLNPRDLSQARGQCVMLVITGGAGLPWAFENCVLEVAASGRRLTA